MIQYVLSGVVYAFAAAVQPGPYQAYLISETLTNGWRRTLPATLAPLVSDGPIILLTLLVLSQVPVWLMRVLRYAGGVFLLYLAYGAWKSWRQYNPRNTEPGASRGETLMKATLVNFLNPNPYLGWSLVMGPLLLKGWHETPANGIGLLAAFYGTMVLCGVGIILLFASARNLGSRISRVLLGISAIALGAFGLYQFWAASAMP